VIAVVAVMIVLAHPNVNVVLIVSVMGSKISEKRAILAFLFNNLLQNIFTFLIQYKYY